MKTKFGKSILKQRTRTIDNLHAELEDIALEFKGFKKEDFDNPYLTHQLDRARDIRKEIEFLQGDINTMIWLEGFL